MNKNVKMRMRKFSESLGGKIPVDPVALPLTFLLPLRLERLKEATKGLLGNSWGEKSKGELPA